MKNSRTGTVVRLGLAQTLAWASSYYLPAILANAMARDLGLATPTIFLAFSVSLVTTALFGPAAGRAIDRLGGRSVLAWNSLVFTAGLALLATAQGVAGLFAGWVVLGIAMSAGLYEGAFAALVHLYDKSARNSITGITLLAGFASTIGWPLTAWFESQWGWRGACLAWAVMHLLIALPLNLSLPRRAVDTPSNSPVPNAPEASEATQATEMPPSLSAAPKGATLNSPQGRRTGVLFAFVFAMTWFISTAMAAHLPRLLQLNGVTLASALVLAGLVGPAQVAGRLLEFTFLRRVSPLLSARLAGTAHTLGAVAFLVVGAPAGALFTLLHGAGNGMLTIAKGTLPLLLFSTRDYGARQGLLMVPARFAQALAPYAFGLALDGMGASALWISAFMGGLGFIALMLLAAPAASARPDVAAAP
ncbi:MAG: MFS transporter [Pseudomonadota bacterium]